MLSVSNLSKSFPTPEGKLEVLNDINFTLNQGTLMSIIGESGSGKSTLLQILGTLDQADSGEIILNHTALHGLPDKQLASLRNQHIGFIYQSHHLIPELTALENVMLPQLIRGDTETSAKDNATKLLQTLGLSDRRHHIPAHLSGGEAQRVAVARAVINQPSLILADEPTGNLDESSAYNVFSMMRDTCKEHNIAVIMVTHSKSFADACDEVYELSHKKLDKVASKNP